MTVAGQSQVAYGYDDADRPTSLAQGTSSVALAYDDGGRMDPEGLVGLPPPHTPNDVEGDPLKWLRD